MEDFVVILIERMDGLKRKDDNAGKDCNQDDLEGDVVGRRMRMKDCVLGDAPEPS